MSKQKVLRSALPLRRSLRLSVGLSVGPLLVIPASKLRVDPDAVCRAAHADVEHTETLMLTRSLAERGASACLTCRPQLCNA